MSETQACETSVAEHVGRFWHLLTTETARVHLDLQRGSAELPYWGGSSFGVDVAAALAAERSDLLHALHECQSVLAMLVAPDAIKQTTVIGTYAAAVAAEALARAAIAKAEGR